VNTHAGFLSAQMFTWHIRGLKVRSVVFSH
jgi:hypothetical protein